MGKLVEKRVTDIDGTGTEFGAQTGPRTLGDVVGADGDMVPLTFGGMLVTSEDDPVVADTDGDPATPAG